ncbi:MAG: DNA recombination protein RmuC [Candidatus Bipolaricaulis sp.]|nr:DNA recombination protein RmuC [Candidatus Bipolaricaulis sp.]MDD5219699.1 DNA recombination protein RmuC [Candidatus Bipolaricaulis sp.]MDD5646593.1 DNA recombination protein RmuC [Candidatus Bipolaricaulis sp.]
MEWVLLVVGLVAGAALGALVAHLRAQTRHATLTAELGSKTEALAGMETLRGENERLRVDVTRAEAERAAAAERAQWIDHAQETLRDVFGSVASTALTTNTEQFLTHTRQQLTGLLEQLRGDWGTQKEELKGLVAPLEKSLTVLDGQIRTLEEKREGAYRSIEQQIRGLGEAQSQLQLTTTTLSQAMKSSTARGRWGELQLRRIAELAGMEDHIDFDEQTVTDEGRPDMVIHLPGGGILPVDAKASAAAYLDAMKLDGDARHGRLTDHVKATRLRIQELARKQYWNQFENAPQLVVMFVPIESALSAAFEEDPELLEYGLKQKILFASPITLYALLRTVAFGWDQLYVAENAHAMAEQGRDLYDRIVNVLDPIADVGRHLEKSVGAYNKAVASLEGRLLPGARRLKEMTASDKELPELQPVDHAPRLPLDVGE